MAAELDSPALPCPECRLRGLGGKARIGNRRNRCTTCNNFAQNVMRLTRRKLKDLHAQEYEMLRQQVELDLYPQVMEDWLEAHPEVTGDMPDYHDPQVASVLAMLAPAEAVER